MIRVSAPLTLAALASLAALTAGCGSLFGIGDLPDIEQNPSASGDGGDNGEAGGTGGAGEAGSDGSVTHTDASNPKDGDPRWALWPMPEDVPPTKNFKIDNGPNGVVVTDLVTGLMWQDAVPNVPRHADEDAQYCETLAYGGFDDWRLPTRIEMVSLMSFAPGGLALQPAAMSPVDDDDPSYWTASVVNAQDSLSSGWSIETSGVRRRSETQVHHARCVRGGPNLTKRQPPSYDLDADSILDPFTGLIWERNPPIDTVSYTSGEARCAALTLRGKTARVPTVKELLTIVDEEDTSPLTPAPFGAQSGRVWSATIINYRFFVDMADGTAESTTNSSSNRVRCVAK